MTKKDLFAAIAATAGPVRSATLVALSPPSPPTRVLPRTRRPARLKRSAQPTDRDLPRLLAAERRRLAKFLRDLAPAVADPRRSLRLDRWQRRLQSAEDRADPGRVQRGDGDWQDVMVPEYGGPQGPVVAYYRCTFAASTELLACARQVIAFAGADYRAHVHLNGAYLGSHEGFFAPFTLEAGPYLRAGANILVVTLENDGTALGVEADGKPATTPMGDKIYAATGPGWDEPGVGWHHCPPGFGLSQAVTVEGRAEVLVDDAWVRTLDLDGAVECWIDLDAPRDGRTHDGRVRVQIEGLNHRGTAIRDLDVPSPGRLGPGRNQLMVAVRIPRPRLWSPGHPWMYRLIVEVLDAGGAVADRLVVAFGIRLFLQDLAGEPKGRLYLNGEEIRLRGANTMGFEEQRVLAGDLAGLTDDLILARVARMNFLRLTQRPVPRAVYAACDRVGILVQSDLPLFGLLPRRQFSEVARQAGELARLVRRHPSVVQVSLINEPFATTWHQQRHRMLSRPELERFFVAAEQALRIEHPDIVLKPIDGDYDPPGPGQPDHHCYTLWYNNHGVQFGVLHRGGWMAAKPGWMLACGEFGAEGLDPEELMRRRYPADWLPAAGAEAAWTPSRICQAQSGRMQPLFWDEPATLAGWVTETRAWQARATKLMTETFRRMPRMNSIAIHLFLDAFPAGWMKAIVDCERRPKPAFWAYREALAPVHVHARTDRGAWWGGEDMDAEVWLCNDTGGDLRGARLSYAVELDGETIASGTCAAQAEACAPRCQGLVRVRLPAVERRGTLRVITAIDDACARRLHDHALELAVWPRQRAPRIAVAALDPAARALCRDLGLTVTDAARASALVIGEVATLVGRRHVIDAALARGATVLVLGLEDGIHDLPGGPVTVEPVCLGEAEFVARVPGHPVVAGFQPDDCRFWYDPAAERIVPLCRSGIAVSPGLEPILLTASGAFWSGAPSRTSYAACERRVGPGMLRFSQVRLAGRCRHNPAAQMLALRLMGWADC